MCKYQQVRYTPWLDPGFPFFHHTLLYTASLLASPIKLINMSATATSRGVQVVSSTPDFSPSYRLSSPIRQSLARPLGSLFWLTGTLNPPRRTLSRDASNGTFPSSASHVKNKLKPQRRKHHGSSYKSALATIRPDGA